MIGPGSNEKIIVHILKNSLPNIYDAVSLPIISREEGVGSAGNPSISITGLAKLPDLS